VNDRVLPPEEVERLRAAYDQCFACGRGNPIGLGLDGFRLEGDDVVVPFRPRPEYRGFAGILHGGIVATALDEILAWAAMYCERVLVFTGTLELRYSRVAAVDAAFELRGRVDERRGRRLRLSGEMLVGDAVVASAHGLYLVNETVAPPVG